MTLVFDKNSWHYRLVVYVFTSEFFLEIDGIDIQSMETVDMEKDFRIIYKKKPRTVNLCPYCRAVVASTVLLPLVFLWRLFPHKKKERTHAEIMKRSEKTSKIVRYTIAGGFVAFGVWKIIHEDYGMGVFYLGLAVFNVKSPKILKWVVTRLNKIHLRKGKPKVIKVKEPKKPSKILTTISKKHDAICPPIFFVDVKNPEELR